MRQIRQIDSTQCENRDLIIFADDKPHLDSVVNCLRGLHAVGALETLQRVSQDVPRSTRKTSIP